VSCIKKAIHPAGEQNINQEITEDEEEGTAWLEHHLKKWYSPFEKGGEVTKIL